MDGLRSGSGSSIKDQGSRIKDYKREEKLREAQTVEKCFKGKGIMVKASKQDTMQWKLKKRKKTDRRSKTTIVVKASLVTTNFSCRCENLYLDFYPPDF